MVRLKVGRCDWVINRVTESPIAFVGAVTSILLWGEIALGFPEVLMMFLGLE